MYFPHDAYFLTQPHGMLYEVNDFNSFFMLKYIDRRQGNDPMQYL